MKYNTNIAILALSILAFFGMFITGNEPIIPPLRDTSVSSILHLFHWENAIIFNVCSGIIGGVIVWYLNIVIPERKMHKILKTNLIIQYQSFREDIIYILLEAEGPIEAERLSQLDDQKILREHFLGENLIRWHNALSYINENPERISDIIHYLQSLSDEIMYFICKINIENEEVHAFFRRLCRYIYSLKNKSEFKDEQVKHIGDFILENLMGRTKCGYLDYDQFEVMISKI